MSQIPLHNSERRARGFLFDVVLDSSAVATAKVVAIMVRACRIRTSLIATKQRENLYN